MQSEQVLDFNCYYAFLYVYVFHATFVSKKISPTLSTALNEVGYNGY